MKHILSLFYTFLLIAFFATINPVYADVSGQVGAQEGGYRARYSVFSDQKLSHYLYPPSSFSAYSGPVALEKIAFRADASNVGSGQFSIEELEVSLWQTGATALDGAFANNASEERVRVFQGALNVQFDSSKKQPSPFFYIPLDSTMSDISR